MTFRRSITNFDAVVSDMRSERRQQTFVLRRADGSWDKSAVLARAHQLAKRLTPSCGLSYREKLALSLRTSWAQGRASGKPSSPSQIDRKFPLSRLVANARQGVAA
jgi:hypothetical protein